MSLRMDNVLIVVDDLAVRRDLFLLIDRATSGDEGEREERQRDGAHHLSLRISPCPSTTASVKMTELRNACAVSRIAAVG